MNSHPLPLGCRFRSTRLRQGQCPAPVHGWQAQDQGQHYEGHQDGAYPQEGPGQGQAVEIRYPFLLIKNLYMNIPQGDICLPICVTYWLCSVSVLRMYEICSILYSLYNIKACKNLQVSNMTLSRYSSLVQNDVVLRILDSFNTMRNRDDR